MRHVRRWREALFGNAREAERHATAAVDRSKGRDVEYAAGLALSLAGDSSRSDGFAGDPEKRFPEDTFAKFTYAPVLRASAALGRGDPEDTMERLQVALPYELAVNGLNFRLNLGAHARRRVKLLRSGRVATRLVTDAIHHPGTTSARRRRPSATLRSRAFIVWEHTTMGIAVGLRM